MATQEVVKHSKKIYKIWNSREHSFLHKLKEFCIEIVIIVFAVSLSIWLHGLSEHREKKQIAQSFLMGLKDDLQTDIKDLNDALQSYQLQKQAFYCYTQAIKHKQYLPQDSIDRHNAWIFFSTTSFTPSQSRFEGLKSAGQIYYIENLALVNDILQLYQNQFQWLSSITNSYVNFKHTKLFDYYDNHLPDGENMEVRINALLKQPIMQRYLRRGALVGQIMEEMEKSKALCIKISQQIDQELLKS